MAFLNPYGLPYLPGSSFKGVMRQAAKELISGDWGDNHGWDQPAMDALFGKETESGDTETERTRGALSFWDVFPWCDRLAADIMTPHYGDYYQGHTTPADCGQPTPILFLTLPPRTPFVFYVQCNPAALSDRLRADWRGLIEAACQHAFDWLGFGAKTAVGYGQMDLDKSEQRRQQEQSESLQAKQAEAAELARLSPLERSIQDILTHRPNPSEPVTTTLFQALERGHWQGDEAVEAARHIQKLMQQEKKWKPQPTGKKPEKDKDHQRTLKVMAYLKGK